MIDWLRKNLLQRLLGVHRDKGDMNVEHFRLIRDEHPDVFLKYLMEWRSGLWESIRHKEDILWRFITFYAAAIPIVLGLTARDVSNMGGYSPIVAPLLVEIVSFWGMTIVLDANFWHFRNIKLISNIERCFFKPEEYDVFLPRSYLFPTFRVQRIYGLHLLVLGVIASLAYYASTYLRFFAPGSLGTVDEVIGLTLCYGFYALGMYWVRHEDHHRIEDYFTFARDAPGIETASDDQAGALEDQRAMAKRSSRLVALTHITIVGASVWATYLVTRAFPTSQVVSYLIIGVYVASVSLQMCLWVSTRYVKPATLDWTLRTMNAFSWVISFLPFAPLFLQVAQLLNLL